MNTFKSLFLVGTVLLFASFSWALVPGDIVTDFSTQNQDGKLIKFSEIKGKPILFYFYPKDETSGCTKQACAFRDRFEEFKKKGYLVFGVSGQDLKSHKEFATKHKLPFDLLDDSTGTLGKILGIEKMAIVGLYKRQSVLVGADGKVLKVYKDVDPKTHASDVLGDLEKLAPVK